MGRALAAGVPCWERVIAATQAGPPSPSILSLYSPRAMAHLYGDPEWSQRDLEGPIKYTREHLTKSKLEAFSAERLASYHRELELRAEQGHPKTFVDLWALVLESMLHGQVGHLCLQGGADIHLWDQGSLAVSRLCVSYRVREAGICG